MKLWSIYDLYTQLTTRYTFFSLPSLTNRCSTQNPCFLDAAACGGYFPALIPRISPNITHFALPTPLMMIAPG